MNRHTAEDAFAERCHNFVVVLDFTAYEATERAAVLLVDDDVVGNVNQTAGEVTGVGGFKGGIGKTLTGTVGRDEVLEYRQTLLKVRQNRVFNNLCAFSTGFLRFCHKATHAGKLTNLVF